MDGRDIGRLLTARESEVLALMARGLTNGEIAAELGISFSTAKTHVSEVISRLGVTSREEAVALWRREQRPAARFRRVLHGLLPAWLGVKQAAGMLAGTAVAGVAAVAVLASLPADSGGPPGRLVVPLADLGPGTPRRYDIPGLGTNSFGQAVPVWVVALDGGEYHAFYGRDPHTGCLLDWQPDYVWEETLRQAGPGEPTDGETILFGPGDVRPAVRVPGFTGAFKAFCGGWVFRNSGEIVFGASPRGLDEYPVRREGDHLVATFDRVQLGACKMPGPVLEPCSLPGQPRIVAAPPSPMIPDYAALTRRTPAPAP